MACPQQAMDVSSYYGNMSDDGDAAGKEMEAGIDAVCRGKRDRYRDRCRMQGKRDRRYCAQARLALSTPVSLQPPEFLHFLK